MVFGLRRWWVTKRRLDAVMGDSEYACIVRTHFGKPQLNLAANGEKLNFCRKSTDEKGHFVLVHGTCHGAWCWYKVATLLSSNGYRVTSLDLGASGISPKQLDDIPTISGYLEPLMELMAALPSDEKVVLVGHSVGGFAISVAMEKFPDKVAVGIYATAVMPNPEYNLLDLNQQYFSNLDSFGDSKFTFDLGPNNPATSVLFGPKFLSSMLYQLSPPEQNYGSVHRAYIVCTDDIIITEEAQRSMIQNYPPDLVKEINGSDHMHVYRVLNSLGHLERLERLTHALRKSIRKLRS
ncbi:hypothetical protein LguiB_002292 [Lonicera macranthoides]